MASFPNQTTAVEAQKDSNNATLAGRENLHTTVVPHESYEGYHCFDPLAEWSVAEEKRVVRKTDVYLLSWLCVMVIIFY